MTVAAPPALYRLTVEGEPVPKARPRLDRHNLRIYTQLTDYAA